ncbi:MAG: VOC family protein [Calditrichaeota bacterium]|nr:VOC family protein [Candidatus Cloacimonadota bacterium]MCB1046666.1 VOC family protein [Calditrichota bacterium]MCB9473065.1 VOC family protein [Candidatus Delongbacteria bacterium]
MSTQSHETHAPLISGLAVIAIYVSNLDRALEFYHGLLGLEKAGPMEPGVLLKAGETVLYLEGGRQVLAAPEMVGCTVSMCLQGPSIRRIWTHLREHGVPVVESWLQHGEDFAMFRVADPDGHVIEFAGTP